MKYYYYYCCYCCCCCRCYKHKSLLIIIIATGNKLYDISLSYNVILLLLLSRPISVFLFTPSTFHTARRTFADITSKLIYMVLYESLMAPVLGTPKPDPDRFVKFELNNDMDMDMKGIYVNNCCFSIFFFSYIYINRTRYVPCFVLLLRFATCCPRVKTITGRCVYA